mmetsp:Transcript_4774/g.8469  ORF Transcript_4774/g.8469 Transcript_4774/m.8469 type:complete len:213 (+) Transcript_4774:916-1554(+)
MKLPCRYRWTNVKAQPVIWRTSLHVDLPDQPHLLMTCRSLRKIEVRNLSKEAGETCIESLHDLIAEVKVDLPFGVWGLGDLLQRWRFAKSGSKQRRCNVRPWRWSLCLPRNNCCRYCCRCDCGQQGGGRGGKTKLHRPVCRNFPIRCWKGHLLFDGRVWVCIVVNIFNCVRPIVRAWCFTIPHERNRWRCARCDDGFCPRGISTIAQLIGPR